MNFMNFASIDWCLSPHFKQEARRESIEGRRGKILGFVGSEKASEAFSYHSRLVSAIFCQQERHTGVFLPLKAMYNCMSGLPQVGFQGFSQYSILVLSFSNPLIHILTFAVKSSVFFTFLKVNSIQKDNLWN